MVWSTESRVRNEAGFGGNSNITTPTIQQYQIQANSIIVGMLGAKYNTSLLTSANDDFVNSHAQNYLARIEELIAAGYLLIKDFGPEGTEEKENGQQKIDQAMDLINAILRTEFPTKLLDINGVEFATIPYQNAGTIRSTGMVGKDFQVTIDKRF